MMAKELTFGVGVLPGGTWEEFIARCQRVEDLGLDMVTTGDHFVDWNDPQRPWLEAWTLLAAVANATSRVRIGIYVSQIPLRNPAMLARQALTVDHISGGRLDVGLGTGLPIDPSYDMIGIPNWDTAERVARLREYVQIVAQLLGNERTSFTGEYYQVNDAVMNPRPLQSPRPPIVVAALGPVMMEITARHADKWNTMSFAANFEEQFAEVGERCKAMDEICVKAGRDPATLQRSFLMFDPDSRASGGSINYYRSDDVFVDQVSRLVELGFTEFSLYYPIIEQEDAAFQRIANEIIPELKRQHGSQT
jgi:alkanesulfonate monooxygenase SsuD/methylene tetrahydromethanopterin reductase-like flavin-dependent oxidoreductase (luciferase family)